jgi:hypothetical protein
VVKMLVLLIAVSALFTSLTPQAQADPGVVFGINDDRFASQFDQMAPMIAPLGNIQVAIWRNADDKSDWSIPLDRGVLVVLNCDQQTLDHPEEFASNVSRLVWKHRNIREVQLCNEPDLCSIGCSRQSIDYIRFYGEHMQRYFDLARITHEALAGSGVLLLGFGFSSPYRHWDPTLVGQEIRWWYDNHGTHMWLCRANDAEGICITGIFSRNPYDKPILDGLAYHPYCGWQSRVTNRLWSELNWYMAALPGGTPGLWQTETGVDTLEIAGMFGYFQGSSPRSRICGRASGSEAEQATYTRKVARQAKRNPHVKGSFVFLLCDEPDLNRMQTGLRRADCSLKPASFAFQKAVSG